MLGLVLAVLWAALGCVLTFAVLAGVLYAIPAFVIAAAFAVRPANRLALLVSLAFGTLVALYSIAVGGLIARPYTAVVLMIIAATIAVISLLALYRRRSHRLANRG